MKYSVLVDTYAKLESTGSSLEKTEILSSLFAKTDPSDLYNVVLLAMGRPFPAWEDLEIGIASQLMVQAVSRATGASKMEVMDMWRETGDLGTTAAHFIANKKQATLFTKKLSVGRVMEIFEKMALLEGKGAQEKKIRYISELLSSSNAQEARYIVRTILGELRIGVGEGIVRDAIAKAFGIEKDSVERAYDVTNDFGLVAQTAYKSGEEGLQKLKIRIFKPVKVMLSQKAANVQEAFKIADENGRVAVEFKYDGMRAQIHKRGDQIVVFTRRLEDVTKQFPDVVEAVKNCVKADKCIIDSEVTAYDPETFKIIPFQNLSKRIKRKYGIDKASKEIPVVVNVFDILFLEDDNCIDLPYRKRWQLLNKIISPKEHELIPVIHIETSSEKEAENLYKKALDAGQEGVMFKNLDAVYKPGSRVGYMLKMKPVLESLDLVIIGAEWGEGKRSNWLSSFKIACMDPVTGGLKEVGKMATGLTEEQFKSITEHLKHLITFQSGRAVKIKPEVVVEVAYEEIQKSPTYDSGFALRFPRLVRIRDDLGPEEIDTLDRIDRIYKSQA